MKFLSLFFAICFFQPVLGQSQPASLPALRIGRVETSSQVTDMAIAVLDAAYKKLGVQVEYVPYPLRRAALMMSKGELDGEVMRIRDYELTAKSLIRIKVPVNFLNIMIFSAPPCPQIRAWDDLKTLKTGYQRGVLLFERKLIKSQSKDYTTYDDIFNGILRKEVNVGVGFSIEGDLAFKKEPPNMLCKASTEIPAEPLYHYLDGRHRGIAKRLENVLQEMEKRGQIRSILDKKRQDFLAKDTKEPSSDP